MCDRLLSLPPADQVERYNEMISAGRKGDAVEFFMAKVVGLPSSSPTRGRSRSGRRPATFIEDDQRFPQRRLRDIQPACGSREGETGS
jgi:hypothetical protein